MQTDVIAKTAKRFTWAGLATLALLLGILLLGRSHWRIVPKVPPQANERLIEHIVAQGGARDSIQINDQWGSCGHVSYRTHSGNLMSSVRFVVLPGEVLLDRFAGFDLGKPFQEAWMKSPCQPAARRFSR